ncbi:hypothetical protein MNB_SUP05-SYMBIONT-4-59 [hydrothermal vent metagenome]|uniref:Polymer-forming cytoskeletal protein n=1 Tax=hydrothermal vent metagenome TaxID=652676 RepID=A0A1W1DUG9_9ZZZZ
MFNTKKPDTTIPPTTSRKPTPRTTNDAQHPLAAKKESIISKGCFIKGEISGVDDISIFGKVDGTITLKDNALTVETSGNVKANIFAKVVNIIGTMAGNIDATEKIVIHENGNATGDMSAPKVILKDGSYFKGNVSMTDSKVTAETQKNKPA